MLHASNPGPGRRKFKTSLGDIANSVPVWATGDPVSEAKVKTKIKWGEKNQPSTKAGNWGKCSEFERLRQENLHFQADWTAW